MAPAQGEGSPPQRSRRWLRKLAILGGILLVLWCVRIPLLRAIGGYLIVEDPIVHVDAVYVLGGAAVDRATEAARLYRRGISEHFVFTGGSVPGDLRALGMDITEGQCAQHVAIEKGVPETMTFALQRGTSTKEEADALVERAVLDGSDTVMIVSNRFHLRRVRYVFRRRFNDAGITVLLHGAPSASFDEQRWWEREEGLMMLNNEYVKLAYYHFKY